MVATSISSTSGPAFAATCAEAVGILRSGGVVALPTETVYGLAADALDPAACAKIFEAKSRPLSDPLIVHIPNFSWIEKLGEPSALAIRLAEAFWPGPLTLVIPRNATVPDIVTGGQDTVALRMSAHPVFQQIIAAFDGPLAAPSANRFGKISPTTAVHVMDELGGRIPMIVDAGPCAHGIESTIVQVTGAEMRILRSGPISAGQLSAFGNVVEPGTATPVTPGSMKSHYAPATPIDILPPDAVMAMSPADRAGAGILLPEPSPELSAGFAAVEHLSATGDLTEMATNLYAAMRRLDAMELNRIITIPARADGIGVAIRERLCKASARE
ncbi:MAG: L-threonylcarbamoyladenylate synthase [Chthoniobacterales bacterium]